MLIPNAKRILSLFSLTAIAAVGTASTPQESHAQYERMSVVSCHPYDDDGYYSGSTYVVSDAIAGLSCPIEDSFDLSKADIEGIEVYTHDGTSVGNNYTRVYACGVDRDSFDAACLLGQSASGSGFKTLALDSSQELDWLKSVHREPYYAWLSVYMRSDATLNIEGQRVMGYTVHD